MRYAGRRQCGLGTVQVEIVGREGGVRSPVRQHGPFVVLQEDDHRAGRQDRIGDEPAYNPVRLEPALCTRSGVVVPHARNERDRYTDRREPCGGVAPGSSRNHPDVARRVTAMNHRGVRADEHVDPDVAHDDDRTWGHVAVLSAASSTATSAASAALASTSSTLARTLSPPEFSWKYSNSRGVTSFPLTPALASSARPAATNRSWTTGSTCRASGSGLARTTPAASVPSTERAWATAAASLADSTRQGTG